MGPKGDHLFLESHLIALIKQQSIVVNNYVNLPCLEVFLPTLIPPSGQNSPLAVQVRHMDSSILLQGMKLAIFKDKVSL